MALPCPLLALSGHLFLRRTCPLSGVKQPPVVNVPRSSDGTGVFLATRFPVIALGKPLGSVRD